LIAFYPQEIHRPQPYVILLDPASGILKRLDLQTAKSYLSAHQSFLPCRGQCLNEGMLRDLPN
jgi:hypothetical protein